MQALPAIKSAHVRRRSGFTLVELLVVIAIIGLIAGTVAVRTAGVTRQARLEWSIGRLMQLDGELRSFSQSRGRRVSLEYELGSNQVRRVYGNSASERTSLSLGENLHLHRLIFPTRETSSGRGIIEYSPEGISPTYAVELRSTGTATQSTWLIFVGMTGQVERSEQEREVVRLVRTLGQPGDDAR
jgi:prepilin-type N-terminal cleavage/methylation domain-containing protein